MQKVTDFDLRLLRIFKTVADCGGFSAAEAALDLNLSTISTHMSDLESRLKLRLCERGRRGFQLTSDGQALYHATERLLASVEGFGAEIDELHQRVGGELNIGTVDNTISDPLSPFSYALGIVKERAGELQIRIEVASPSEIEAAVQQGKLHLGVGPFRQPQAGLHYVPLYEEQMLLYCGQGHPIFEKAPDRLDTSMLDGLDYVSRGYLRETKALGQTFAFNVAATVHDMEASAMLVLSGHFLGFLPDHYAKQWVDKDLMRPILPANLGHTAPFSVVTQKSRDALPAARVFISALQARCGR